MPRSLGHGLDRTATPWSDGNTCLLGKEFGSDLVAYTAHNIAIGPDEDEVHLPAEIGEGGLFCDESPTHPDSLSACRRKRPPQAGIVDVTALALLRVRVKDSSCAQTDGFICFPDKHGVALAFGEQRDGPERRAVLLIELPGRMDEAHGSLAAVHNRDALKFIFHKALDQTGIMGYESGCYQVERHGRSQRFYLLSIDGIRERDRVIAAQEQETVAAAIEDFSVKAVLFGLASDHRIQRND
jgi:hypothetical protein